MYKKDTKNLDYEKEIGLEFVKATHKRIQHRLIQCGYQKNLQGTGP